MQEEVACETKQKKENNIYFYKVGKSSVFLTKMPVSCLQGDAMSVAESNLNGGTLQLRSRQQQQQQQQQQPRMEAVVTSAVLNAAEQFAFMQQALLVQIFRFN